MDSTIVKLDASINSMIRVNLTPEDYWKKLDVYEKDLKRKEAAEVLPEKLIKTKWGKEEGI